MRVELVVAQNPGHPRKLHALKPAEPGKSSASPCGLQLGRALRHFELLEVIWPNLPCASFDAKHQSKGCSRLLCGVAADLPQPRRAPSSSTSPSSSSSG